VRPGGGVRRQCWSSQALGDGVDLSDMVDESDDSNQLELELIQPNYDPLPAGNVSGELDSDAAALIVGPLVEREPGTRSTPTFRSTSRDPSRRPAARITPPPAAHRPQHADARRST
jgi:hypothetical protein